MFGNIRARWRKLVGGGASSDLPRRQAALLRLSAELAAGLDEEDICRHVVDGLHATLGYDFVALFRLEESSGDRMRIASVGYSDEPARLSPGEGLSERAFLTGQFQYTPDVAGEPSYVYGMGGSQVDVPIWIGGAVLGVLTAESRQKDAFGRDDFEVLTAAAQQTGLAIEKIRLLTIERNRADQLDALRITMAEIIAKLDRSSVLNAIVERAASLLNTTGGELALLDEASQELEIVVSYNLGRDYVGSRMALGEGAMGRAAQTGEPLIIEDYQSWAGGLSEYPQIHATIVAPLMIGDRLVGVFTTVSTDPDRRFDQSDLHLVNLFGQQVAIAIENARLYDEAQREIAERKRYEAEIIHQKEYFEALFVNNPVAVVTADLDGTIVSWNPMAEKLFKYRPDEAIGRYLDDVVANDASIRDEAVRFTDEVMRKGRVQAITQRTTKQGALVDVELLALPVIVGEQEVGFICIYVDVTTLQEARRAAEAASRSKSMFLANMSHELRTPLNAVLGFTELMARDSNLTPEQQENLAIINQSGDHLQGLINDVLEMSKIESGRATVQTNSFDLHLMLRELDSLLRIQAEEKQLDMDISWDANTPRYIVTDEGKLRQVLLNLLGNAIKFTHAGEVGLRVATLLANVDSGETPLILNFEVEDTGPGIAVEDLATVFEPFVQAMSAGQARSGTGLGLAISRQFVNLLGGELAVSSKLQRGSVFAFGIPVEVADPEQVLANQQAQLPLALAPGQPVYRLLVAEDWAVGRRLLTKMLTPLGFAVEVATNGQEAVDTWERWKPHLIWMDMRMPVLDGYEATREIRARQQTQLATAGDEQPVVIVALTASVFAEDRERILAAGCDDVVRKPFRQHEIYDALTKHLGVRFLHEKKQDQAAKEYTSGDMLAADIGIAASLASQPEAWAAALRDAIIRADYDQMLQLIAQLSSQDPVAGQRLAELAQRFDYSKLLSLLGDDGVSA